MSQDRFQAVENEYFRLKGMRVAGRLTQEQYDAALKQLPVQDAQGRYWMLGVEDSQWYVHDGKTWVAANPYTIAAPERAVAAHVPPPPPPRTNRGGMIALGIGGIVLLCVLTSIGIFVLVNLGIIRIGPQSRNAPLVLPTPIIFPTPLPIPTFAPPIALPLPTALPVPTNPLPLTATFTPTLTATLTPTLTPTLALTPTPTLTPTLTPQPQGNCADPNARWENVTDGQTIDPYMAFVGTATVENFAEYRVEWLRPGNVLHRSTTPVVHGVIFVWNTYTVENGDYPVALIVIRKDGTALASCVVMVRVRR
ncbi:MAG: hypothetical protein HZC40_18240 [Chloroflexi bacterium]|nr:hypothetical protein [Chloroflexota bacterium]